jgi:hypothetical protein
LDDYNLVVNLPLRNSHHHYRQYHLAGFASGLAAGVAAFSSLAGLLVAGALSSFFLANFISVFGASALAGAAGAVTAGAAGAALGASAANAVATDNVVIRAIANVFILVSFKLMKVEQHFIVYIYITR